MIPDPTLTPRLPFPVPGLRRRTFLQAGAFASLGLSLPSRLLQAEATVKNTVAEGEAGDDPLLHPGLFLRRPQPYRLVGYETVGPEGSPGRVQTHFDHRAGHASLRAPAANGPHGPQMVGHSEHASPDDQPQRRRRRGDVRPHAIAGRSGASGRRRPQFPGLRSRAELSPPRFADRPAARRPAARDVQRRPTSRADGRFSRTGLRAIPDHQRPERPAVRRLDLETADRRLRRPPQGAKSTPLGH